MTDGEQPAEGKQQETSDLLAEFKKEMAEQIATMKSAFESQIKELQETNEKLNKDKEDLQRALVRSATVAPPSDPAPSETPEEKEKREYDELVAKLTERTRKAIQ